MGCSAEQMVEISAKPVKFVPMLILDIRISMLA
jgi:hypothetical protein